MKTKQKNLIPPGATIGILGGGQLARMFIFEAKRMGYNVIVLDPTTNCSAGQVADKQVVAKFDDISAAIKMAQMCDIITYDFENVDVKVVEAIEKSGKVVSPSSKVLKITQNRILEKEFVKKCGIKVTNFISVNSDIELEEAIEKIGFPAVLKTANGGYDGKGQLMLESTADAEAAFEALGKKDLIYEKKVNFVKEISIICARNKSREIVSYPISENIHKHNILDMTIVPARISKNSEQKARKIGEKIAKELDLVGVFCVELFLLKNGELLVNEIAPRPHNSGHYTIDTCFVSQFEQQLRAICNLPLGNTEMHSKACMINILGDGKGNKIDGIEKSLRDKKIKLHLYGKTEAKDKRKMGHLTAVGKNINNAIKSASSARKKLTWLSN